jgi:hypothetical protein
MRRDEEEEEM